MAALYEENESRSMISRIITQNQNNVRFMLPRTFLSKLRKGNTYFKKPNHICKHTPNHIYISTTPHKNIETNSRFTRKIDISSHMESLNFQSGNDETA